MPYASAHAPIYGYLNGSRHTIPLHLVHYARTFSLMKLLNRLPFASVLNVGGADGFQSHLIREAWSVPTTTVDLSLRFLQAARGFFSLPSVCGDGRLLPFRDRAFDLVLCVETIEHVPHPERLVAELRRVSRRAVVVSTESYFESDEQRRQFLLYLHETHPQLFRRTQRVEPMDVNHFIREDFERLFETTHLGFFGQFDRKRREILAPIEEVRRTIRQMTTDLPVNRASRVIVLYSHTGRPLYLPAPRVEEDNLLRLVVNEGPVFPMDVDAEMRREDETTRREISRWWAARTRVASIDPAEVPALPIDEEESDGVAVKWLTADDADASPRFCVRQMEIRPNGFTPMRAHAWEHQLYILEGRGHVEDGGETVAVQPGRMMRIPPHVPHRVRSGPEEPLKYLDIVPSVTSFFGR